MNLTAWMWRSGESWTFEVPKVPGLLTRAGRVYELVHGVATEYRILTGELPEFFLMALEVPSGSSWLRAPWPVRNTWRELVSHGAGWKRRRSAVAI